MSVPKLSQIIDIILGLFRKGPDNLSQKEWEQLEETTEIVLQFGKDIPEEERAGYGALNFIAKKRNEKNKPQDSEE